MDMKETEILFFLIVVIMIRSRKTGNVSIVNYLASGFMYAKCANLILFFMADPRLGLAYGLLFLLQVSKLFFLSVAFCLNFSYVLYEFYEFYEMCTGYLDKYAIIFGS